jgi:hypothetical protein
MNLLPPNYSHIQDSTYTIQDNLNASNDRGGNGCGDFRKRYEYEDRGIK